MCSPLSLCLFIQSVYAYTYPPTTPINVREECAPDKISLLYAVDCLFYRYDKQQWIKYIWAIGLLAAGQSSTMTVSCGVYDVISCWLIITIVWQFSAMAVTRRAYV